MIALKLSGGGPGGWLICAGLVLMHPACDPGEACLSIICL